ncbi:FliC/FljB family flagellin [Halomonas sp. 328]|uniref:FliC/FljB family flagellin n=1 Tax=Halomonas sp. 328 TaxID=2776704 RepID=UPI0018A7AE0C|nr:FliC/FljB family flagellin [Halomonas sp. 328]MBF8224403.1 FliC/FljB family flagellin [Halomonas sp. 328]
MSVINTNITSMIGQSNLNKSQNALQTSMERLSSGLRINSAKDDAAGQAIANRMTAQVNGLAQAQRNANDGISLAQTAEGSLNQVNDNLQRIRELSVQAQNGTNSANDLKSIQDEIGQRLAEIDRISEETSFNGVSVLASDQGVKIQVGANDGETITVNLQEINSETLSLGTFNVDGVNTDNLQAAVLTDDDDNTVGGAITLQDEDGNTITASGDGFQEITDEDGNGTGQYVIETLNDAGETVYLNVTNVDITTGTAGDGTDSTAVVTADATYERGELSESPLASLDTALNQVDTLRSELGAVQNRFEDAITNLSTNETNLAAARSRIEDADYAVEVANMTRAQILQQAGTSVLAQANQIPQNVLSLLG